MNNKRLLALYGIKWNPFAKSIPMEGMHIDDALNRFVWNIENLVMDGGFGMITGGVGTGKSISLRWLASKLDELEDVQVAEFGRPQSNIADFYRELGDLFQISMQVSNKFNCYKGLRERWQSHIETTHFRPVLLIDEAQEMLPAVLSELRLISSNSFDSKSILTTILCGDERLPDKFRRPELMPLGSRIKERLVTEHKSKEELASILKDLTRKAGNPSLMTAQLIQTLSERSMGNYRAMMQMSDKILNEGVRQESSQLDEKLFFEIFDTTKQSRRHSNGK